MYFLDIRSQEKYSLQNENDCGITTGKFKTLDSLEFVLMRI